MVNVLNLSSFIRNKPKIISTIVILFYLLIISVNANQLLLFSSYVTDGSNSFQLSKTTDAEYGQELLLQDSDYLASFQILIHNTNGTILSSEIKEIITNIIDMILNNSNIEPFLSPKKPYSSLFDEADDLLRRSLRSQWFVTETIYGLLSSIWGGTERFSAIWLSYYNTSNDIYEATNQTLQTNQVFFTNYLQNNNLTRYREWYSSFITHLADNFLDIIILSSSIPSSDDEVLIMLKSLIANNDSFFSSITTDNLEQEIALELSSGYNTSLWADDFYPYLVSSIFLYNQNDTATAEFIEEVYAQGTLDGYILAKNKYLLPLLKQEVILPCFNQQMVDLFLSQFTNYRYNPLVDAILSTFYLTVDYTNKEGKKLYNEIFELIKFLNDEFSFLEIYISGINPFLYELIQDLTAQNRQTLIISTILVIIILLLIYQSPTFIFLLLFVLTNALAIARLLFLFVNNHIHSLFNLSSIILTVTLFCTTTFYSLFLVQVFLKNLKQGKSKHVTIRDTLKYTTKRVLFSSLFFSIGFGSLLLISIPQMKGIGIAGIIAVVTGMLISITLVPAILALLHREWFEKWKFRSVIKENVKNKFYHKMKISIQNPLKILSIAFIITIVGTTIFFFSPINYGLPSSSDRYLSSKGDEAIDKYYGSTYASQIIITYQLPEDKFFLFKNGTLNYRSIDHITKLINEIINKTAIEYHFGISHPLRTPYDQSINNESYFIRETIKRMMKTFVINDNSGFSYLESQYEVGDGRLSIQVEYIRQLIQKFKNEEGLDEWEIYVTGYAAYLVDSKNQIKQELILLIILIPVTISLLLAIYLKNSLLVLKELFTIYLSLGTSMGFFALFINLFFAISIYWIVPLFLYSLLPVFWINFDIFCLDLFIFSNKKENKDRKVLILLSIKNSMKQISASGIVFVCIFFALTFSSSPFIQQLGIGVGFGLILHIFVSRFVIIPSIFTLSLNINLAHKNAKILKRREHNEE